jgi:hypothetical protein
MSEDAPQHPREITLELIFRQGQRILGELGQIREKQDEMLPGSLGSSVRLLTCAARIEHRLDLVDESASSS